MNKKLLFGIMSLAALAACSDMNDLESKNIADEAVSPVQFEIINDNVATRASMDGNKIVWNANEGDIFTLYHGAARTTPGATTGYQNASYTANANEEGPASLTTPTMILEGSAIMVWPADTTFRIKSSDNLTIEIPVVQGGKVDGKEIIQHQIPYVSDLINIQPYAAYSETGTGIPTAYKTAGKGRKYQIYMRPMASQLNLKADYAGTEDDIAALYEGATGVAEGEGIDSIKVTSVDLLTTAAGSTKFTTKIPLKFATPTAAQGANWPTVTNNIWDQVTDFDLTGIVAAGQVDKLTTKCLLDKNKGCKFLILPQADMSTGKEVTEGAVVVNTTYGKVVVAPTTFGTNTGKYKATEIADAWYRITGEAVPAATAALYNETAATAAETGGEFAGKFKTTADVKNGMAQVIDAFSKNKATSSTSKVKGEPTGAAGTRYVKVLLNYLDMTDLHIKSDKQLRDAAKVWQKMGLDDVTVYLDGDANNEFEISQNTIKVINDINAAVAGKDFKVKPCQVAGEVCNTIVITGGGNIKDLTFIKDNAGTQAVVAFKAGETWKWSTNNTVKVANTACGISKFVNRGTFTSDATATINVKNDLATPAWVNMPFENAEGATWDITGATLRVQFDVTNYGTVNIAKGAQYRQDGNAGATVFTNEATGIPARFTYSGAIPRGDDKVGTVWNRGVFATLGTGGTATINNYGLIEHDDVDAKTYITANDNGGAGFGTAFGGGNKMGRINLPWLNRNEDNISISAALNSGFVSLTVDDNFTSEALSLATGTIGDKVNYLKVNSASVKEITGVVNQIDYLEVQAPNEVAWNVTGTAYNFVGLMVLSDVNIKLGTTVNVTGASYIGADMYVGGTFNNAGWSGFFGNTTTNATTMYITY